MSQERLNDAAMCNIHQNVLDDVDVRQLLKEFVARNKCASEAFWQLYLNQIRVNMQTVWNLIGRLKVCVALKTIKVEFIN